MGYTHYFPGLRVAADLCADARKIVAASDTAICGPRGDGLPVISESEGIRLNGAKAAGGACETFRLIGTSGPASAVLPDSCKTNGKPYDEVVTAILIAAAVRLMNVRAGAFTSDGRWDNWTAGLDLYERAVRALTAEEKLALELDVAQMRPQTFHD